MVFDFLQKNQKLPEVLLEGQRPCSKQTIYNLQQM